MLMTQGLPRLAASTLTNDCYAALKRAILDLELLPISPLDEGQLASQLGVSKTPVREAIARLAGEGFVTNHGNRKHVAPLSVETIRDVYQLRIILESASIRQVTSKLTEADHTHLDDLIHQAESALQSEQMTDFVAANDAFHAWLVQRSDNKYLVRVVEGLFDQAHRVRAALFQVEQQYPRHELSQKGFASHRAILDAIIAQDSERASMAISSDIQIFLDAIDTEEMRDAFQKLSYQQ